MESPPTDNPSRLCNGFVQSGAAGEIEICDSPPLPDVVVVGAVLTVVWIVLVGGIAALIIFPPDSVLTAEFRH
jgi:hypothetical protein